MRCKQGQGKLSGLVLKDELTGGFIFCLQVGDWRAVQQKCYLGKIQPSVLFYQANWMIPPKGNRRVSRN